MKYFRSSGFTLIEVVVSLMILSIGVLGVTAMQVRALQANRGALLRVEANQLASDLTDRIDVNSGVSYGPLALDEDPGTAVDCSLNDCNPDQMAAFDITQWRCSINSADADGLPLTECATLGISGTLPLGKASIALDSGEYNIRVEWQSAGTDRSSSIELVVKEDS